MSVLDAFVYVDNRVVIAEAACDFHDGRKRCGLPHGHDTTHPDYSGEWHALITSRRITLVKAVKA